MVPTTLDDHRSASVGLSDDVRAYVAKHQLDDPLRSTLHLALEELPNGSDVELGVRCDPEADDEWLVVHLKINSPRNQVFELYNRFVETWLETASLAAQFRMHFTYDSTQVGSDTTPKKPIDEVRMIATWLHGAAAQAGQSELVRSLIRAAFQESEQMYALPNEDDEEPDNPEDVPTILGRFAAAWDDIERAHRKDEGERNTTSA